MGYTYSFMNNAQYGASDINSVLASLVTGGIADPFTDGVPYNATKLNEIISAVSSAGIVPETDTSCKCVIDTENSTVSIMKGMAFFNDGSRIVFDEEGETLEYIPGVKNFVYLKAAPLENRNYPVCSTIALTGDVLLLAEIDETGVLTDKRTYARGKLPGYQSNFNTVMHIDDEVVLNVKYNENGRQLDNYGPEKYVIHLGGNNYTKLYYHSEFAYAAYDIATGAISGYYRLTYDRYSPITTDMMMLQLRPGYTLYNSQAMAYFERIGTDLILTITAYDAYSDAGTTVTVPLKFTLVY